MKKYILVMATLLFLLCPLTGTAKEDYVLDVWGIFDDIRSEYAERMLKEKYPGIEVTYQWSDSGSSFVNRLFSRDPGIDLIGIQDWNNGVSGRFLATSGLLENLNNYPELLALREEMNSINDPYMLGDIWFGVNNWTERRLWYGNTALFQQLGLDMPATDWNWDDFYALGKQVYEYNQANGTDYKLIYESDMSPYVIKQYLYNTTDYWNGTHQLHNDRFRELVSQWLQLREWGVSHDVSDNETYRDMGFVLPDTLIKVQLTCFSRLLQTNPDISANSEKAVYKLLTPPTENGMHTSLCQPIGIGIASYTKLKEEALYFLTCYMHKDSSVTTESHRLMRTEVGDVFSPFYNNGPFYKDDPMLASLDLPHNSWIKENIDHWVAMMNDCEGEYYDPDMAHTVCYAFDDGLMAMKNGKITLDEYIQNCCRIADQYLGE